MQCCRKIRVDFFFKADALEIVQVVYALHETIGEKWLSVHCALMPQYIIRIVSS